MAHNIEGLIFKKLREILPVTIIEYWLAVPEFRKEIGRLASTRKTINTFVIFKAMQNVYFAKQHKKLFIKFRFHQTRRSLRVLAEYLTGNRDHWDNADIPDYHMDYWENIRQFRKARRNAMSTEELFQLMQYIYFKKSAAADKGNRQDNFVFAVAKQSLQALSVSLCGDRNMWRGVHTELDFLYKQLEAPYPALMCWIRVPEFYNEIKRIIDAGEVLTNEMVFRIMLRIYKIYEARGHIYFPFSGTRSALKRLSEQLYGDRDFMSK